MTQDHKQKVAEQLLTAESKTQACIHTLEQALDRLHGQLKDCQTIRYIVENHRLTPEGEQLAHEYLVTGRPILNIKTTDTVEVIK